MHVKVNLEVHQYRRKQKNSAKENKLESVGFCEGLKCEDSGNANGRLPKKKKDKVDVPVGPQNCKH